MVSNLLHSYLGVDESVMEQIKRTLNVLPRTQNRQKLAFKNLQVQSMVTIDGRSLTHGPSCTSVDCNNNSPKTHPENWTKCQTIDRPTV